jgi:hypothetical protein
LSFGDFWREKELQPVWACNKSTEIATEGCLPPIPDIGTLRRDLCIFFHGTFSHHYRIFLCTLHTHSTIIFITPQDLLLYSLIILTFDLQKFIFYFWKCRQKRTTLSTLIYFRFLKHCSNYKHIDSISMNFQTFIADQ